MPDQVDLSYAFGLPPEKAVEYFRSKGYAIGWDWRETLHEAHAKAFTVAKVMKIDVLQDIRAAVDKAIANGDTLTQFKKELIPTLQKKGWWGEVTNEQTGETAYVNARRLNTIYQTNLQTAYMTGRYRSMMENTADRPYWQYIAVMDGKTRPAHRALHGKIFRFDDPIWSYIYPPNGFRCRCRVRALSAADVKRAGLTVEASAGKLDFIEVPLGGDDSFITVARYRGTDATGKGFAFSPDAGWNYNPGESWSRWDINGRLPDCSWLAGQNFSAGGAGCIKPIGGQPTWRTMGRTDLRDIAPELRLPPPQILEAAPSRQAAVELLATTLGISAKSPLRIIQSPIEELAIRYEWLPHMVGKELDARERYANFILPTLTNPFEIWAPIYDDGTIRERYIGLFQGKKDFMVVVRVNTDGSLMWNIMQAESKKMNPHRIGGLIYAK